MAWRTWRGLIGGSATLLLMATAAPAQTTPASATSTQPTKPVAAKPAAAKPAPAKIAAKKSVPAHPAAKLAAAKPKSPDKKTATAAKKPLPAKTVASTAKKPAEPAKIAIAKPQPPSYTVTTTRGGVTATTTRIVPLPTVVATAQATPAKAAVATTAPPLAEAQIAATPVSLTQPAAKPIAEKPAASAPAPIQAAGAPQKASGEAAASFVTNFLKSAFHLARAPDATSLQRRAQLADLFAGKMDVKRIAGYTTANELTGATADIQNRFRTILVSYLVETYYPRLELASDPSVKVETTPAETLPDGTAVVWTTFTKDGWGSQSVKWHLQAEDGGYKIVDILTAGASLVQMERDTFQSVMRDGGLNELMAKLDARTKQLATAATE